MNIQAIQNKAKKIMSLDTQIWNKYGWKSGGEVNFAVYQQELNKKVKGKLPILFYYIFEDANYHTLNKALEELKKFKGSYGSDEAERQWNEYRKAGGKTWNF